MTESIYSSAEAVNSLQDRSTQFSPEANAFSYIIFGEMLFLWYKGCNIPELAFFQPRRRAFILGF